MGVGILIYEDNASLRESLKTLLTLSQTYTVLGAFEECSKISERAEEDKPDVILMDIDLPALMALKQ